MKIGYVSATNWFFDVLEFADLETAQEHFGLTNDVERLSIGDGVYIIFEKDNLKGDPKKPRYFAIGRTLYAGSVIIYGIEKKQIVDIDTKKTTLGNLNAVDVIAKAITYFTDAEAVEYHIQNDLIDRPTDGDWSWSLTQEQNNA